MKRLFLMFVVLITFTNSKAQHDPSFPFYQHIIDGTAEQFEITDFTHFHVLDSIKEGDYGNWLYTFRLVKYDSVKFKQFQINHLQDSLNLKLNIDDVPDWAKQPTPSDIFGTVIQLTNTEILAILSPIISKIYYNTTINEFVFYDGTSWQKLPKSPM